MIDMHRHEPLKLNNFKEGLEDVEVGLTPLPLEGIPEDYRVGLVEIQRAHHDQVNKLQKAIAEYDERYDAHSDHNGGVPHAH